MFSETSRSGNTLVMGFPFQGTFVAFEIWKTLLFFVKQVDTCGFPVPIPMAWSPFLGIISISTSFLCPQFLDWSPI